MSDQTPPSDASDPSASVDQPPSAIVGTPPASPPAKRKAPAASIIAIVFILVAAGAVSWVLLQLRSDTSTGATPSHPPTAPGDSTGQDAQAGAVRR